MVCGTVLHWPGSIGCGRAQPRMVELQQDENSAPGRGAGGEDPFLSPREGSADEHASFPPWL